MNARIDILVKDPFNKKIKQDTYLVYKFLNEFIKKTGVVKFETIQTLIPKIKSPEDLYTYCIYQLRMLNILSLDERYKNWHFLKTDNRELFINIPTQLKYSESQVYFDTKIKRTIYHTLLNNYLAELFIKNGYKKIFLEKEIKKVTKIDKRNEKFIFLDKQKLEGIMEIKEKSKDKDFNDVIKNYKIKVFGGDMNIYFEDKIINVETETVFRSKKNILEKVIKMNQQNELYPDKIIHIFFGDEKTTTKIQKTIKENITNIQIPNNLLIYSLKGNKLEQELSFKKLISVFKRV